MISDMSSDDGDHNPPTNYSVSTTSSRKKIQLRVNSRDLDMESDLGSVRSSNKNLILQSGGSPGNGGTVKVKDDDEHHHHSNFLKRLTIKGALNITHGLHGLHLNEHSFHDLKHKLFHGKGIRKLKSISKRRRQRKRSSSYAKRKKIGKMMNSRWVLAVMLLATFYLLFIDDLMLATGAPDDHVSFTVISVLKIVVFIVFLIDMVCSIYVQRLYYVLSFYLIFDLISLASLVPDIISFIFGISSIAHAINSLSLSRTARVARIASRLSRITKLVNFFNFLQCSKRVEAKEDHNLQLTMEPSSIGKQLLGRTSHKVMVMALIIVLITVLTNPQASSDDLNDSILNLLISSANTNGIYSAEFEAVFASFQADSSNVDVLYLAINDILVYQSPIDTSDWFVSYISKTTIGDSELWINNKWQEQVMAALAITLTVCLIIILMVGTLLISRDFQELVIKPIERMVSLIKKISSMDRGFDSDYESETEEQLTDYNTEGINMSDMDVEGQFESDTESYGGFTDEPETNIIVELLSDIALKKAEVAKKEKTIIEAQAQIRSGFEALGPVSASFLCRKRLSEEHKRHVRRRHIVNELLKTEEQYVQSLETVVEGFLVPLRNGDKSDLVDVEMVNGIFSNIEVIHEFNKGFLHILEERINNWHINQPLGESLNYLYSNSIDIYAQYVNNYNNAMKIVVDLQKENEKFAEFLLEARDDPNVGKGSDLMSYLIKPIQRMPRYALLLEDLHKHTDAEHFDKNSIEHAVKSVKKLNVAINEAKRQHENKSQLQDIYMKLVPPEPDVLSPGNSLLIQSNLKQDSDKFLFFLFQHGLLKTEKKENELHVISYHPIKETTTFTMTPIQDCPSKNIHNAFQVKIDSDLLLLFAKSTDLRNQWLNAVTQLTKVQHQRTKSMQFAAGSIRKSHRGSTNNLSPNLSSSRLSFSSTKSPLSLGSASPSPSSSNLKNTLQINNSNNNNNNNNNNS